MQQSRCSDIQLLQQHLMLKQLQELQRQQQLPQFCDLRQQNNMTYPFAAAKKAAGDFPQGPLVNGALGHDASQLFTNWDERSASTIVQGWQNRFGASIDQGLAVHDSGFLPQLGASVGSPAASTRSSDSHGSHLRGISPETANLFAKSSDYQAPTSALQSSTIGNSFLGDQVNVSSEQVCMSEGSYMYDDSYLNPNMFERHPCQSSDSGPLQGTLQQGNILQTSTSLSDFSWKQEQAGWPGNLQQEPAQLGPAQGLVPLDPLEKKILYNIDDNTWDASFGRSSGLGARGFGNSFQPMDSFPSIQSGSWSALMQSAVAETSSGDTGLTEEWSSLNVQNAENSTATQPSIADSVKQPTGWADANSHSAGSLASRPISAFNNSTMSPGLPIFQHSGIQSSNKQQEILHLDVSHGYIHDQKSVTLAGQWLDRNSMQKSPTEGSQRFQPFSHMNTWTAHNYDHSDLNLDQHSVTSHSYGRPSQAQEQGEGNEGICKVASKTNVMGLGDNAIPLNSWRLTEGLQQLHSATGNLPLKKEDPKMNIFSGIQNFSGGMAHHAANQQIPDCNLPNSTSQFGIPMYEKGIVCTERNLDQINDRDVLPSADEVANEICPVDNVKDKFIGPDQEHFKQLKLLDNASNSSTIVVTEELGYFGGHLKESDKFASSDDPKTNRSASLDGSVSPSKISITALRSVAERDWAQATNRLIEKVQNELDGQPKVQSKRRLILTTQLMQQLLRAPPASNLSSDAALTYDWLTYFVAKLAFGDACSLTDCPNSNRISENIKAYLGNSDDNLPKLVEELISRMKTLEDDLARLEKSTFISDTRVEFQELERYSVINRFAKFHVRPQPTSGGVAAPKPNPQRYAIALSMPETPPEVQCLPL